MRSGIIWVLGGVLAFASVAAKAQAPAPLLHHSFDEVTGGWTAIGANARVTINAQSSFNGQGALKYEYDVKQGALTAMIFPTPNGLPATAKAFRFWINPDYATTLALILQEKEGARYLVPFAAPKGKWQKVEVSILDFTLMEGPGNPPDTDSKLDLDQVAAIAIADVGQIFGLIDNPDVEKLLGTKPGAHTLAMDDFTVTEEILPAAFTAAGGEARIDTFARPQISWIAAGGATLSRIESKSAAERGMQADYRQAPARIMGLMRLLPLGKLQGMGRLRFTVSSTQGVTLLVQLEETGGGKFNATIDVPEGGEAKVVTLDLADLKPADESSVKDRSVKPELVGQFAILDATGLMGLTSERENTLRVTGLSASAAR